MVLLTATLWIGLNGVSAVALANPVIRLDGEFRVNTNTSRNPYYARLSHDPGGNLAVVRNSPLLALSALALRWRFARPGS